MHKHTNVKFGTIKRIYCAAKQQNVTIRKQ